MIKYWHAINLTFNFKHNYQDLKYLKRFTKIILSLFLITNLLIFIIQHQYNLLGLIGLVYGFCLSTNLVLSDEGKLTNYGWGIIACLLAIVIAIVNHLIGNILINIYYILMQLFGIGTWTLLSQQRKAKGDSLFVPKILTKKQIISLVILGILIYWIVVYLSYLFHGTQIYVDSLVFPIGIIGMYLRTLGYFEQYYVWIVLDLINIFIWFNQLQALSPASLSLFILSLLTLVNSCYGLYRWLQRKTKS